MWNGTTGNHLALFSEDVAFARHLVAPSAPSTLPPRLHQSRAIQLAIQCTADIVNYHEYSYRFVEKYLQETPIILEIYWIEYFKFVFLNISRTIYNCACKTLFENPVICTESGNASYSEERSGHVRL